MRESTAFPYLYSFGRTTAFRGSFPSVPGPHRWICTRVHVRDRSRFWQVLQGFCIGLVGQTLLNLRLHWAETGIVFARSGLGPATLSFGFFFLHAFSRVEVQSIKVHLG